MEGTQTKHTYKSTRSHPVQVPGVATDQFQPVAPVADVARDSAAVAAAATAVCVGAVVAALPADYLPLGGTDFSDHRTAVEDIHPIDSVTALVATTQLVEPDEGTPNRLAVVGGHILEDIVEDTFVQQHPAEEDSLGAGMDSLVGEDIPVVHLLQEEFRNDQSMNTDLYQACLVQRQSRSYFLLVTKELQY
jgi:hypothetical protein